jgi:hypothetical protein
MKEANFHAQTQNFFPSLVYRGKFEFITDWSIQFGGKQTKTGLMLLLI